MKKPILQEEKIIDDIKFIIIKEKIKNSYIQIKGNNVIVKTSIYSDTEYIDNLIQSKIKWVKKKLFEQENKLNNEYVENGIIRLLGKKYILKIKYEDISKIKIFKENNFIYIIANNKENKLSENEIEKIIIEYYRYIAKQEVKAAMEDLQKRTGLIPLECKIKNLKATWGICSSKRKISINLNLMAYSRHAIEYVCLHELCHLKHMNHSKEFWDLVKYYMPDYKLAKAELKG